MGKQRHNYVPLSSPLSLSSFFLPSTRNLLRQRGDECVQSGRDEMEERREEGGGGRGCPEGKERIGRWKEYCLFHSSKSTMKSTQ